MTKKLLALVVLGFGIMGLGKSASAATYASASVNVTLTGTLSMSIVGSTFTILASMAPGGSAVATSSITIKNDSVGIAETLSLKSFDSTPWTLAQSPAFNQFALQAMFNTVAPAAANFAVGDDSLTTADKVSTSAVFAGNQTGVTVPPGESRGLWVRFQAPTSTSSLGTRDLTITITAGI